MTADKYRIRLWNIVQVNGKEIAHDGTYTRGAVTTAILLQKAFTLWALFEGYDAQMRKLEFCLNADTTCTKPYVPQCVPMPKVEHRQRKQTCWHFGYHTFSTARQTEVFLGDTEGTRADCSLTKYDTVG